MSSVSSSFGMTEIVQPLIAPMMVSEAAVILRSVICRVMDSMTSSPERTSATNISRFSSVGDWVQAGEHEADGSQMLAAGLGPQSGRQRFVDEFASVRPHAGEQDDGAPASPGVGGVAGLGTE